MPSLGSDVLCVGWKLRRQYDELAQPRDQPAAVLLRLDEQKPLVYLMSCLLRDTDQNT